MAEATTRPSRRVALRNVRYAFWLKITFGTPGATRAMSSGPYASGTTSTSCPVTPIGGYTTRVVFSNHVQRNPAARVEHRRADTGVVEQVDGAVDGAHASTRPLEIGGHEQDHRGGVPAGAPWTAAATSRR